MISDEPWKTILIPNSRRRWKESMWELRQNQSVWCSCEANLSEFLELLFNREEGRHLLHPNGISLWQRMRGLDTFLVGNYYMFQQLKSAWSINICAAFDNTENKRHAGRSAQSYDVLYYATNDSEIHILGEEYDEFGFDYRVRLIVTRFFQLRCCMHSPITLVKSRYRTFS